MKTTIALSIALSISSLVMFGCERKPNEPQPTTRPNASTSVPVVRRECAMTEPPPPPPPIVAAAREQIGKTVTYDPSYVRLDYPMGDVPIDRGVCTDVVIRALRDGINADLQQLLHEDMRIVFSDYPKIWGLKRPDRNIDHRRVPNLRFYFERQRCSLGVSRNKQEYLPGDIVTCKVSNRPHIMIVSDRKTSDGVPLVIHNIGRGAQEENSLFTFPISGHYRIPGSTPRR
jgi:uncharacterized protein YijF (DUF1287 family)